MTPTKNVMISNSSHDSLWKKYLTQAEFVLLCLVIMVLPSFEAPKHIFWVLYFITATTRLILNRSLFQWKWPDLFFGLWLASALASTLGAGMAGHHEWKGVKDLFIYSSTAWLIYRSHYTNKQLTSLLIVAVITVIPPLLWGTWLHLGPTHKQFMELKSVGHVNHSAIYLTIVLGIGLSITLVKWKISKLINKFLLIFIILLLFSGIVMSQSRACLGIGITMSFFLLLNLIDGSFKKCGAIGLVIMTFSFITLNNPIVIQKQKNLMSSNAILNGRSQVWNVSLEAARWHPILGLGMDNWKLITPDSIKNSIEKRGEVYDASNYFFPNHSHNVYLTVLVERGIIGLSTFLLILIAWGIQLARSYQSLKKNSQLIIWGSSLSAYIVVIGVGMVNTTLHHEHGLLTALCLGIFLSATNSTRTSNLKN